MSNKTKVIFALMVFLIIILGMRPELVNDIYKTILGRIVLIGVIIFCAMNNLTLGLLVTLVIISGLNQYGSFVEGMSSTIGDDSDTTKVLTKDKVKELAKESGVDKEDIKTAIMAKDSKTIPLNKQMTSSEEVDAHSPGMVSPGNKLAEGFASNAGSAY